MEKKCTERKMDFCLFFLIKRKRRITATTQQPMDEMCGFVPSHSGSWETVIACYSGRPKGQIPFIEDYYYYSTRKELISSNDFDKNLKYTEKIDQQIHIVICHLLRTAAEENEKKIEKKRNKKVSPGDPILAGLWAHIEARSILAKKRDNNTLYAATVVWLAQLQRERETRNNKLSCPQLQSRADVTIFIFFGGGGEGEVCIDQVSWAAIWNIDSLARRTAQLSFVFDQFQPRTYIKL